MLRKNLEWLDGKHGMQAVLYKTTVARKVLAYAWQRGMRIASAPCITSIHAHISAPKASGGS
ncbi:MAG: hypothetical protein D6823_13445 [Chloroflexi bacterium]|nr:MAG: hypothetical protein D6823_13445 [Chloroflexota bacterium]